jgi:hypothetical protein
LTGPVDRRLPNALPFSSKPAAESASRFYTDAPAAGLSAATAASESLLDHNQIEVVAFATKPSAALHTA